MAASMASSAYHAWQLVIGSSIKAHRHGISRSGIGIERHQAIKRNGGAGNGNGESQRNGACDNKRVSAKKRCGSGCGVGVA